MSVRGAPVVAEAKNRCPARDSSVERDLQVSRPVTGVVVALEEPAG